ncbi:MAG: transcription antitermination factor NusB [Clostridia bacterium]|nr:transcription antitermination factor NusB [Clostridia bacterium]MBR3810103.1 transcription antitermination factor NusB [Clostridia bacterium]
MTRHEAREQAFAVVFEKSFNEGASFQEIIDGAQECELVKINGFAGSLLNIIEENLEKIDETIEESLVNWSLQRLPKVSLAVLRLAVAEILFNEDVPASVSVNEAVEIAKTFGSEEDASYINGVLSTIVKKIK